MSSTMNASEDYLALIKRFPLRPIRDDQSLDVACEVFSELTLKSHKRTADESDYLTILGGIIAEYEESLKTLTPPMIPARALKSLMEDHNISQSDLAGKLKTSQSVISEFLTGKRGLSKALLIKLADFFKVSPQLFLPQADQLGGGK